MFCGATWYFDMTMWAAKRRRISGRSAILAADKRIGGGTMRHMSLNAHQRLALLFACALVILLSACAIPGAKGKLAEPPALNAPLTTQSPVIEYETTHQWGRLANPGFENQRIKTTLFFAGQERGDFHPYGCQPDSNLDVYMVKPIDALHRHWSEDSRNRDAVLDQMLAAGINVVTMSSWGEDFLTCTVGWAIEAPMQTAPAAHDELFASAVGKPLLVTPLIESRGDWNLRNEFPTWTDGRVAPGTVSQINNLVNRYLKNPAHPEWADQWARVYDRNLQPRYAVALIHAASNRLKPKAVGVHTNFAAGFDMVAAKVFRATGVRVGFLIDPLPPGTNAPGEFKPDPNRTGPALLATDAILGIQAFIPEIWLPNPGSDTDLINWKRDFSRRWSGSGIPFLMDISPGYDAHIVFPGSIIYGLSAEWRHALTAMVMEFGDDGLAFNSWNGYTESMAAVPTEEYGATYYAWLTTACTLVGE